MAYRFALILLPLFLISITATQIHADDFGAPFTEETPMGFSDPITPPSNTSESASINEFMGDMNAIANELQNIAPAAGDPSSDTPDTPETSNTDDTSESHPSHQE